MSRAGCPARSSRQRRAKKKTLAERDGLCCAYCGCGLTLESATLDHFIPLSRGGTWANTNLRLACLPCNARKADKRPQKWLVQIGARA